jgi:magnesium chelatase subunit I
LLAQAKSVQGLIELAQHLDLGAKPSEPVLASAVDFVLEGLYAQKKISRSDDRGYHAAEQPQRRPTSRAVERDLDEGLPLPGGKKKYYN